jgi:hypothetical protein
LCNLTLIFVHEKWYTNNNRTHHASDFSCATRWDFLIYGVLYVTRDENEYSQK